MLASPSTLNRYIADKHFAGDTLHSLIVRALGDARCISVKEVVESFEVFQRLRKPIRSKYVMDLCCGHGLVGMLMVIFEPDVESVTLCDRRIPESSHRCLAAIESVAPWVKGRVRHEVGSIKKLADTEARSMLSAHACGALTDHALTAAIERQCPVAVTPCCYANGICQAPPVLRRELGLKAAIDTHRTYRLNEHGYHVKWMHIPEHVTPMNRVIISKR